MIGFYCVNYMVIDIVGNSKKDKDKGDDVF